MNMPTFDELKDLAQRDPEGFDRLRRQLIDDCIRQCAESRQERLRGRQFVIDARCRAAGNPTKALLEIQGMMYESLSRLQQALDNHECPPEYPASSGAIVLPFQKSLSSGD